jgi:DNA-binding MarR family transcriptional regulator
VPLKLIFSRGHYGAFSEVGTYLPGNREAFQMVGAKRAVAAVSAPVQGAADLKPLYLEALTLVERLHRRLLDVIKDEFDRSGRSDVNSVQALLLFNIGDSELTAGELRTRGYYLGSNVSYNLKKLVEMGYIHHQRSRMDRRSVRVSLTEKGTEVAEIVAALYDRHVRSIDQVGGIDAEDFHSLNRSLQRLERFWTDQILYRL